MSDVKPDKPKKMPSPRPVRGTQDLFGEAAAKFEHVVDTFHRVRKLYGFKRVEVPVFEATSVFSRAMGETTDVVSKEMYTFEDRGGDSLTLRPEFTAGIARAYISEGWQQHGVLKLATHGPLFRYERPQKGRFRQFHQLDAEVIGAAEPAADVELLVLADHVLRELGITDGVTLRLNTLGDAESRDAWRAGLVKHFEAHKDALSPESIERLAKNPMRILDSKDPRDIPVAQAAPDIDAYLTAEAGAFFEKVQAGLQAAGITPKRDGRLVRGLDYYRHTAFEFVPDAGSALAEKLGSQSTILGGGRYDGLIETLGGAPTPAVGWAAGIERLMMLVGGPLDDAPEFIVALAPQKVEQAFQHKYDEMLVRAEVALLTTLRKRNATADVLRSGKRDKQIERARRQGARAILFITPQQTGKFFVQPMQLCEPPYDAFHRVGQLTYPYAKYRADLKAFDFEEFFQ